MDDVKAAASDTQDAAGKETSHVQSRHDLCLPYLSLFIFVITRFILDIVVNLHLITKLPCGTKIFFVTKILIASQWLLIDHRAPRLQ